VATESVQTSQPHGRPHLRLWWFPFVLLSLLWGSSFLFMKVALESFSPIQISFGRIAIGAIVLIIAVYASGDRLPRDRRIWLHSAVSALFLHSIPFTLFPFGEERIPSILAGIWNATTPLWMVVTVLVILPSERATVQRLIGLGIGFVGVVTVLAPWNGMTSGSWIGSLACMLAALCYAIGTPYAKRFLGGTPTSGIALASVQLTLGALWLVPLTIVQPRPHDVTVNTAGSVVMLGLLGTGLAFYLYWRLIRTIGASSTTTVTYLVPIWATLLGVMVLGEALHWNEPVGTLVILVGVAVSEGLIRSRRRVGNPAAATPPL
jgi:drug/metabolite transporter (DMT)-like permease